MDRGFILRYVGRQDANPRVVNTSKKNVGAFHELKFGKMWLRRFASQKGTSGSRHVRTKGSAASSTNMSPKSELPRPCKYLITPRPFADLS